MCCWRPPPPAVPSSPATFPAAVKPSKNPGPALPSRTGFTFRTQDKYALYEAMGRFARMNRQQREEMGLAGRARMEEFFDRQIVVEDTMNAIFRP